MKPLRLKTLHMMSLFLLLIAFFSVGYSSDSYDEVEYGSSLSKTMPPWVDYIEFFPNSSLNATMVWSRDAPKTSENSKWKIVYYMFYLRDITQRESGRYLLRNRNQTSLSTMTVEVIAKTRNITRKTDQKLSITFNLPSSSCNIYFIPRDGPKAEIVRRGQLQDKSACGEFTLLEPCGALNKAVQSSCSGQFVVRDHNDDQALVMFVEVESSGYKTYIFASVGALICTFLSCCIRTCCCRMCSEKKAEREPDGESAQEPVVLSPSQPSEPTESYPLQSSNKPTDLLIHNPSESLPPSKSEELRTSHTNVPVPAEQLDPSTVPLWTNPDQDKLEEKGINTNNLLSSDSLHSDVYTSEKLNFL
ncbi:uncharacterized protein V3H82_004837 [Fundulus diaphanus]